MKKATNVSEEKADNLDVNKRITKNVSENVHKVDSIISSARSSNSLFNIQAISARIRLRDACERAILSGSSSFSQRMEEILWRKVYYEPLASAKKLKKGATWYDTEAGLIWAHLNDGIAFYHHLLLSLAFSSNTSVQYTADLLPLPYHDDELKVKTTIPEQSLYDSLFRSLTCLGDLARYMLDIPSQISTSYSYLLSVRYYHQALHYNCEGGLTHSNLATVYSAHNHPLLGALHYLRAITCEKPFEAAENNLKRMLDKSRICLENRKLEKDATKDQNLETASTHFLHTCLALVSCFINNKSVEEIAVLCQDVLIQLGKLLDDYDNVEPPDVSEASDTPSGVPGPAGGGVSMKGLNGCIDFPLGGLKPDPSSTDAGNKLNVEGSSSVFLLTPESMVTLCALFIICVKRLKSQGSPHTNMSEVLLISILLTLVSHINTRLEQRFSLIDPTFVMKLLPQPQEQNAKTEDETKENEKDEPMCNGEKSKKGQKSRRNKLSKLRRRRKKKSSGEDGTELDGNDFDDDSNDSCDDSVGGESSSEFEIDEDDFDPSILCSSEDEDSDEDVRVECEEEWDGITDEEHLQLVEQEGMLAAVNVTLLWLSSNQETLKMYAKTAHNLWTSLAKLFNLMKVDFQKLDLQESSSCKKKLVESLKVMNELGRNVSNDDLELTLPCLPENLMLHFVIPSFRKNKTKHNLKPAEMNLLRLYRLNSTVLALCSRDDIPLKIKDRQYICCKEKMEALPDSAKLENDKLSGDRSTPTTSDTSVSTPRTPVTTSTTTQKPDESSITTTSSSPSTPKRGSSGPPPISSKVASSMQSLTAQWLQHEVRNLEEKTSRRTKLGGLYLVPDASVLIHHLQSVKQVLATPSYMVIIPQIVIDSLDQQKRDSVGARDAIRWLEVKLRHGSRFMRAQRPHEKAHLPLIKYPKRKDKDAWEWFHLAECCYYLGAQMNKSSPKTSTVTLLTSEMSSKGVKRSFSLQTLAGAAGATLQSIEEFTRKWQSSTKGHS